MDVFKVEQYELEHPGMKFPSFRALSSTETASIRDRLKERLGTPSNTSALELVSHLAKVQRPLGINIQHANVDFYALVATCGGHVSELVCINWDRFDSIDEMKSRDLFDHIEDVWYPSSDDIDVFPWNLTWFLSISDSGSVRCVSW